MSTPLEDWYASVEDQKTLEKFMRSATGEKFLRVLESYCRPKPEAVPGTGTEGAIQAGVMYHKIAGMYEALDIIPTLYPAHISDIKRMTAARAKVSQGRQLEKIQKPS